MAPRSRTSRWLFRIVCGLAMLLVVFVLVAPILADEEPATSTGRRIIYLFARDVALRRTSLASATGLLVTACVFFQPAASAPTRRGPVSRPRRSNVAGA